MSDGERLAVNLVVKMARQFHRTRLTREIPGHLDDYAKASDIAAFLAAERRRP